MPRIRSAPRPRRLLRRAKVVNNLPAGKVPMATLVARSSRVYNNVRTATPRFRPPPRGSGASSGAVYDRDTGSNRSIARRVAASRRGRFRTAKRFAEPKKQDTSSDITVQDDIAHRIATSERRYSVMRSNTPRFRRHSVAGGMEHLGPGYIDADDRKVRKRPLSAHVPRSPRFNSNRPGYGADVTYNIDQGAKATVATAVARSGRRYSVMSTQSPRFRAGDQDRELQSTLAAVEYDTDKGANATIASRVATSGNQYQIVFNNATPRFSTTAGADPYLQEAISYTEYNTDVAGKATIATSVATSNKRYASMVSTTRRFRHGQPQGAGADLGPGSIDVDYRAVKAHTQAARISETARFTQKVDASKHLGSTYKPKHDTKHWDKSAKMSQTKRPPLLVGSMTGKITEVDQGRKMSLHTSVRKSPRKYSNVGSSARREVAPIAYIANDPRMASTTMRMDTTLGPGSHDPRVMKDGRFATISRSDAWAKPSPAFASTRTRFEYTGRASPAVPEQ